MEFEGLRWAPREGVPCNVPPQELPLLMSAAEDPRGGVLALPSPFWEEPVFLGSCPVWASLKPTSRMPKPQVRKGRPDAGAIEGT